MITQLSLSAPAALTPSSSLSPAFIHLIADWQQPRGPNQEHLSPKPNPKTLCMCLTQTAIAVFVRCEIVTTQPKEERNQTT